MKHFPFPFSNVSVVSSFPCNDALIGNTCVSREYARRVHCTAMLRFPLGEMKRRSSVTSWLRSPLTLLVTWWTKEALHSPVSLFLSLPFKIRVGNKTEKRTLSTKDLKFSIFFFLFFYLVFSLSLSLSLSLRRRIFFRWPDAGLMHSPFS